MNRWDGRARAFWPTRTSGLPPASITKNESNILGGSFNVFCAGDPTLTGCGAFTLGGTAQPGTDYTLGSATTILPQELLMDKADNRILALATSEAGRRRAISGATLPIDWEWPPRSPRAL